VVRGGAGGGGRGLVARGDVVARARGIDGHRVVVLAAAAAGARAVLLRLTLAAVRAADAGGVRAVVLGALGGGGAVGGGAGALGTVGGGCWLGGGLGVGDLLLGDPGSLFGLRGARGVDGWG
jgi:hypothetical protein